NICLPNTIVNEARLHIPRKGIFGSFRQSRPCGDSLFPRILWTKSNSDLVIVPDLEYSICITHRKKEVAHTVTQKEQVIEAMRQNGGYATFGQLNGMLDFSSWKTRTPQASVRRIVQVNREFFKVSPGLWALADRRNTVLSKFEIKDNDEKRKAEFSHSYFQGLLVEMGNFQGFDTYVPNQDKNRRFLEKPLGSIATLKEIHAFTYPPILSKAKTVDVVWFNARKLPQAFFEVEHSTDIQNSLVKFYELQDFAARFCIVAPDYRKRQFDSVTQLSVFERIRSRVEFISYDDIAKEHEKRSMGRLF
ncbi:MAG TPA: hypothetical protein VN446_01450, partial [Candidatus Acidoferrum sp.]|nr:hypothetical protein [Candidatus Acidoferrum sp.]